MKIVINGCFGIFSLSKAAVRWLADAQGRECYFFEGAGLGRMGEYTPVDSKEGGVFWAAFDIPNPNTVLRPKGKVEDELYVAHNLDGRWEDRADPLLVAVVEELGSDQASGCYAKLRVIEIPDGVEWEIEEYDGMEWVAEKHRTWGAYEEKG